MPGDEQNLRGLDAAQVEALINSHFPQIHAAAAPCRSKRRARAARGCSSENRIGTSDRAARYRGQVCLRSRTFPFTSPSLPRWAKPASKPVTTNLNINFLAKPEPRDLIASVRPLRVGRRLAVGEAQLCSDGAADLVAHAIATYALPSSPRGH